VKTLKIHNVPVLSVHVSVQRGGRVWSGCCSYPCPSTGLRNGTWIGGVWSRGVIIWIFLLKIASKNSGNSESMEDWNEEIMKRLAMLQQINREDAAKSAKRVRMELTSSALLLRGRLPLGRQGLGTGCVKFKKPSQPKLSNLSPWKQRWNNFLRR